MTNNLPRFSLRLWLWVALAALALLNYQTWMHDYGPPPGAVTAPPVTGAAPHSVAPANDLSSRIPETPRIATPAPGERAPAGEAAAAASVPGAAPATAATSTAAAPLVHVRTDVLDLDISTRGGTLTRADLLAYPQVKGEATPVRLENEDDPLTLYDLQSGLTGPGGAPYPTHLATYASEQADYTLDGRNELRVPLTWTDAAGVTVTKTFVFHRGAYRIDVQYEVHNGASAPWAARPYAQILRADPPTKRSMFNVESYAFHGPAIYDGTKYRKLDTTDAQDSHLSLEVRDGWLAALQHHFVSAVVPPRGAPWRFTLGGSGNQYLLSATGPSQSVTPGATARSIASSTSKTMRAASRM